MVSVIGLKSFPTMIKCLTKIFLWWQNHSTGIQHWAEGIWESNKRCLSDSCLNRTRERLCTTFLNLLRVFVHLVAFPNLDPTLISLPWGQKVAHFSMKSQLNASLWGKFKYSLSLCAPNIHIFALSQDSTMNISHDPWLPFSYHRLHIAFSCPTDGLRN